MKEEKALCEQAAKRFREGYNCAQSVLWTLFEHWNGENKLVPNIATAFGAGIGRCGSICGALTGGVMAIGAKYGTNEPSVEKRLKSYQLAQKLYKQFEKHYGSVMCRELIGYNLSNPKELKEARKSGVFDEKCIGFVKMVVQTILELSEHQP